MCHLEIIHLDGKREEIPLRYCGRELCFLDKVRLTAAMFRRIRRHSNARIVTRSPEKIRYLLQLPKDEPGIEKPRRVY